MKLISLYIDNFGKLSDYSFDFSKTLNSLYEENGWGKTTLTVFKQPSYLSSKFFTLSSRVSSEWN